MKTQIQTSKTASMKVDKGNLLKQASLKNNQLNDLAKPGQKLSNNFKSQLEDVLKRGKQSTHNAAQSQTKGTHLHQKNVSDHQKLIGRLDEQNPVEKMDQAVKGLDSKVNEHPKLMKALQKLQKSMSNVQNEDTLKNVADRAPEKKKAIRVSKLPFQAEEILATKPELQMRNSIAKKQMSGAYVAQSNDQKMIKPLQAKSLKQDESEKSSKGSSHEVVSAKDFSLNLAAGQGLKTDNVVSIAAAKPVMDLSHIDASNKESLVEQVRNYIVQSSVAAGKEVSLTVNHDELGMFDIKVAKVNNSDELNLVINTRKSEGSEFFNQNQGELLGSIKNAGIKLGEFQLTSDTESGMSGDNHPSSQQFSDQRKQNSDSRKERREQLWDMYKERMSA